ncbi:MAG: shikimate kinase [Lachnospiraceae bacterium]|nr:shikimate kinase [Lachnospiraceae bacterium]
MKILLFGVSNVGKSTTGELLAERLGVTFYDLDDEIKAQPGMTLEEFVHTVDLRRRDHLRCCMIKKFLHSEENLILAVSPISYPENLKAKITDDVLSTSSDF